MKKTILIIVFCLFALFNSSCITTTELDGYSTTTVEYSDVYINTGISYPVYYIDYIPYYWYIDHWIIVPRNNYHLIRHFDHPRYFSAHYPRGHYNHHYRRPHTRHSYNGGRNYNHRPQINNRPRINHGRSNGGFNQFRPKPRPQSRPRPNGRHFGGRR